jgi:UTP:GlnB (protein PII) uridylyltransferase
MKFKNWLLQESIDISQLGGKFLQLLDNIKQDAKHHKEGDVLTHTKMVVAALEPVRLKLQNIQKDPNHPLCPVISDIDFNISDEEKDILTLAAFLHDIAKATRTEERDGKITSYGHQESKHFKPLIAYVSEDFDPAVKQIYHQHEALIDWLVENHMHLCGNIFSKKFLKDFFVNGKIINNQRIKLLLIIMWADQSGRHQDHVEANIAQTTQRIVDSAKKQASKPLSKPKQEFTPQEFIQLLRKQGLSDQAIKGHLMKKFTLDNKQADELL